jgi:hypothetical protein
MSLRKWRAVVTFYSETPDEDKAADTHADVLTDELHLSAESIRAIEYGSVKVAELDTIQEAEE